MKMSHCHELLTFEEQKHADPLNFGNNDENTVLSQSVDNI